MLLCVVYPHVPHVDIYEEDIEFESDAQFPDPQAAKTLLTNGVTPISSVEVATHALSRVLK